MRSIALLLQRYRSARRDVLAAKAARCQRETAEAAAAKSAAVAAYREACASSVHAHIGLAPREFAEVIKPGLEALVARRAANCSRAADRHEEARARGESARKAVQRQEQALLRGEQLVRLLREDAHRSERVAESLDEDDLATARAWRG